MTLCYDRKLSIVVATDGGEGLDLAEFRVVFQVRRGDFLTPNTCDVRIYNLATSTVNRLLTVGEFSRISISAGYVSSAAAGLIFTGSIKQVRAGRVDQRDSYVDITAADGDEIYNFAVTSRAFAAGTGPRGPIAEFLSSMLLAASLKNPELRAATDTKAVEGHIPEIATDGSIRGFVIHGNLRDELDDFARQHDLMPSIQDGKLTLIPQAGFIPGEVAILSPSTGVVGIPEQTQNGVEVRMLLNADLKIGQLVRIDSTINLYRYGLDFASMKGNLTAADKQLRRNSDGLYYVMAANHSGDTRGNDWYTDLICLAVDATVPMDAASPITVPS